MRSAPVSAVVTNYNGLDCLASTLESLLAYPEPFAEIIVVDDGSTDGSLEMARSRFPAVRLIPLGRNTANLAIVRNAGLRAATSRYVFLTDNDIVLRPGCIERLFATLVETPDAFSVTPRLYDQADVDSVYQSGNGLHFLAVSTGSRRGWRRDTTPAGMPQPNFGGGIMLLDLERVEDIGGFDPGYVHGWADDSELHCCGALLGYRSLHDPRAEALVKVRAHGTNRAFGQYHNRLRFMLTVYSRTTLLMLGPALLIFEVAVCLAAAASGSTAAYGRAWRHLWRARVEVLERRWHLQRTRVAADFSFLSHGTFEFPGQWALPSVVNAGIHALQRAFDVFWWLAYPILRLR